MTIQQIDDYLSVHPEGPVSVTGDEMRSHLYALHERHGRLNRNPGGLAYPYRVLDGDMVRAVEIATEVILATGGKPDYSIGRDYPEWHCRDCGRDNGPSDSPYCPSCGAEIH